MRKITILFILISLILSVRCAYASITIYADQAAAQAAGQLGIGDFEALLTWDQAAHHLTISLENTTDGTIGGYITRFAFNLPNNLGPSNTLDLISVPPPYQALLDPSNESPFGVFDYGVDLRDTPDTHGIGIGESGVFIFDVSLDAGEVLTEDDFINELSDNKDKAGEFFLVRFQELPNDGSDKVPGRTDGNPVPEPATMLLLGPALLGLFGVEKRRRKF